MHAWDNPKRSQQHQANHIASPVCCVRGPVSVCVRVCVHLYMDRQWWFLSFILGPTICWCLCSVFRKTTQRLCKFSEEFSAQHLEFYQRFSPAVFWIIRDLLLYSSVKSKRQGKWWNITFIKFNYYYCGTKRQSRLNLVSKHEKKINASAHRRQQHSHIHTFRFYSYTYKGAIDFFCILNSMLWHTILFIDFYFVFWRSTCCRPVESTMILIKYFLNW